MKCNICNHTTFIDFNSRQGVMCENCKSKERTRLFWMYLENVNLPADAKVLHIAPEEGIYHELSKKLKPGNYIVADLFPERYKFTETCIKMDLCDLDRENSEEYDLILHVHVMEHIPCNIAYTLYHLHRMLKKDGSHLCVIPFLGGKWDECFADIGVDERVRRFGQHDHVRRFGRADIGSHLGSIVRLPDHFDARDTFSPEVLRQANIPESEWSGFGTSTVLNLKRGDMSLLRG